MSADTVLAPLRAALDACRATVQVRPRLLSLPLTPVQEVRQPGQPGRGGRFPGDPSRGRAAPAPGAPQS